MDGKPGFDPQHVLTVKVSFNPKKTEEPAKRLQHIDELLDQFRRLPDVTSASSVSRPPLLLSILRDWFRRLESLSRVVIVADYSRDLPSILSVLPNVDELGFADYAVILRSGMQESMNTNFDGSVTLQRRDFHSSGNKLAGYLAAEIVFDTGDYSVTTKRRITFVVKKLCVLRPKGGDLRYIAIIYGVK